MKTIDIARRNGAGVILRTADSKWCKVSNWSNGTGQVYGHKLYCGKWADYGEIPATGLHLEALPVRRFTVIGTDRAKGAIGIMEPFRVDVLAFNRESAWSQAWDDRWNNGRDCMLATWIFESEYRRGRDDYENIRFMAQDELQPAAYVSESEFEEMLGCVPPIYSRDARGFLVGEALSGRVYANYFRDEMGNCRARYHYLARESAHA